MKPPSTVTVGPFDYSLHVGGTAWDKARLAESDANLIGHHSPSSLTIAIQPGLAAGAAREVVLHEVLHACFNAAGAPLADDAEETAVRTLAPQLLAVLRGNPDLTAYLLG